MELHYGKLMAGLTVYVGVVFCVNGLWFVCGIGEMDNFPEKSA